MASSFNRIILLGNLTRDPQLRYLPDQTPVVDFGMACNRRWKDAQNQDREEVMFIDCSAFRRAAEVINQYCQKGVALLVEGRLKLDTWEDKQGGGKRSKHVVVVENFTLMPRRDGGAGPGTPGAEGSQGPAAPQPQRRPMPARPTAQQAPAAAQQPPYDEQPQFKEDDIPF